jgi:hypothetical protein
VRKTQDPIAGLKERLLGADLVTADDMKVGHYLWRGAPKRKGLGKQNFE